MQLRLPQTHIYALKPSLDFESAKQQAFDKRVGVVAGGLGGLLSRPKPDDVELVYDEVRLESFWHIACTGRGHASCLRSRNHRSPRPRSCRL